MMKKGVVGRKSEAHSATFRRSRVNLKGGFHTAQQPRLKSDDAEGTGDAVLSACSRYRLVEARVALA